MKTINSIFEICGSDFMAYNPEGDWVGKYFDDVPNILILKECAGVYVFTLCDEVVYVGSSINLFNRFRTHVMNIQHGDNCLHSTPAERKYYYFNNHIKDIQFKVIATYDKCISKEELESYENQYIDLYSPIFNINCGQKINQWCGTEEDIEDFVLGLLTVDDLMRKMKSNTTK